MPIRERFIHTIHAVCQRIRCFLRPEYPAVAFRASQEMRCRHRRLTIAFMLIMLMALLLLIGPTIIREIQAPNMMRFVALLIGFCLFFPLYHGFLITASYFFGEWLFGEVWYISDGSLIRASRVARKQLRLAEVSCVEYEHHPKRGFVFRLHIALQEPVAPTASWDIVDVDDRVGLFSAIRPYMAPSVTIRESTWYSIEWTHAMRKAIFLFGAGGAILAAIVYFSYPYL